MSKFSAGGWKVEFDSASTNQDVVVINTCGFINDARQESIDTILEYARAKTEGKIGKLCITGCLSQKYKDELLSEIPEADLILGVDAIDKLAGNFGIENVQCLTGSRLLSTPSHYAYLKISEGCNRRCSFCVIPEIRGRYISRPVENLVEEAWMLSEKGVKELILVAQDLTWYGNDLYGKNKLKDLLVKLESVKGIEWIRLHYAFPANFPEELLDLMKQSSIICNYLDLPLQHVTDRMLKLMRRGISRRKTLGLIDKIREKVPGVALRTTILTGHPGETEQDFRQLKDFMVDTRFDRLGVFPYSHEENTYAFNNYKDEITDQERSARVSEIMQIQQEISLSLNREKIGKTLRVLIDRVDEEFYYARSEFDSPEVDNEVLVKNNNACSPGQFCDVRIIDAGEFELSAEMAG